jgi:hypothetical protein
MSSMPFKPSLRRQRADRSGYARAFIVDLLIRVGVAD